MAERTLEEEFRDYLETLPIQTLRTLGRKFGSPASSRKNKPECIESIIELLTGKADPVPNSGKGAPVKQNFLDPSIIRRLEELRLAWEKAHKIPEPQNYFTVHSPKQPKSLYDEPVYSGILEIMPGGYGFLRSQSCHPSKSDVFIAAPLVQSLLLKEGDLVACTAKQAEKGEPPAMEHLLSVNGMPFPDLSQRPAFEALTACYPQERIPLSQKDNTLSLRVIDLFTPIGKGQRALIIAPPQAGTTTLFKEIAHSCAALRPQIHLIVLLINGRPEEINEIRSTIPDAEVVFSSFDEDPHQHVRAAELTVARAKRLAEHGRDVVVLLDSLDHLTKAYHYGTENMGRSLPGRLDVGALTMAKRFMGAARNTREAGSITIAATLYTDGSRAGDMIMEEFRQTGNCEIVLSRQLAARRIYPAIDLSRSGTRKAELLLTETELSAVRKLSDKIAAGDLMSILTLMNKTKDNTEFAAKCDEAFSSEK